MMTNPNSPRSWLMGTIKSIIESADKIMLPHKYNFVNNREATNFNTKLLKKEKYDLTKVLEKAKGSLMEPGSEFQEKNKLKTFSSTMSIGQRWRRSYPTGSTIPSHTYRTRF